LARKEELAEQQKEELKRWEELQAIIKGASEAFAQAFNGEIGMTVYLDGQGIVLAQRRFENLNGTGWRSQ
jgi:hypothetical protein